MTDWPTFDSCLLRPTTPGPQKKVRKFKYVRYPIAETREHVGEILKSCCTPVSHGKIKWPAGCSYYILWNDNVIPITHAFWTDNSRQRGGKVKKLKQWKIIINLTLLVQLQVKRWCKTLSLIRQCYRIISCFLSSFFFQNSRHGLKCFISKTIYSYTKNVGHLTFDFVSSRFVL